MPKISLPVNYSPRDYQLPLWQYLVSGGDRAVCVWHRRAGKDLLLINWVSFCACMPPGSHPHARVGTYWHIFPEFNHGRRAIWDTVRSDGFKYLHAFPQELVEGINNQEMRVSFKNGSQYQIIGGDDKDRLVGANPVGLIFSEYALMNPESWAYLSPILLENKGWAVFISTPRGENHFYRIFESAKTDKRWFNSFLTINDTFKTDPETGEKSPLVTKDDIEDMIRAGQIKPDDVQQEFYCSFRKAISGSYYGNLTEDLEKQNRFTSVPWEPRLQVHTSWDLGMDDSTPILFWQITHSGEIRLIDFYENSGEPLSHYVKTIRSKPYDYACHYLPWDVAVRDMSSGKSRLDVLRSLGLKNVRSVTKLKVEDGIEAVRNIIPRLWIDKDKCKRVLEAFKTYRKEWNEQFQTFRSTPTHDWSSHIADAARYFAVGHRQPSSTSDKRQTSSRKSYAII